MAVDKIPMYRNINYDYKTDDDTFIARGLHLNELNDKLSMVIDEVDDLTALVQGVWTDNGTSLSPLTSGHDILLRNSTERLLFGDGDSYFYEISDDSLGMYIVNNPVMVWSTTGTASYGNLIPQTTNKSRDLGSTTRFWRYTYTDRLYVDNTSTYVDIDGSNNMTFTDAVTGTVTLASLVGGGSSYTFDSGLTEAAGNVDLGGALTADINWTGATNTYDINIGTALDRLGEAGIYVENNITLYASATTAEINLSVGETKYFVMNDTHMRITDSADSTGLIYAADYSTVGTTLDRWIPDYAAVKAYADSVASGTVTSVAAGNGMTFTTITTTGTVTMGTPTTLTLTTTNTVGVGTHEHALSIADVSTSASGLAPAHGGVGASYFLNAAGTWTIPGGGSGTVTEVTSSTINQLTVATGTTTPALSIVTGSVGNGATALATGDQIYDFVIGLGYSTTVGTVTSVTGTGTVDGLTLSGTVTSSGNLTLSGNVSVSSATGTLPVSHGGTGLTTIGTNYVLTGNGTAAMTAEANMTFSGSTLAVTGAITATGEITAYSSDIRLKTKILPISNPLEKVERLNGVTYEWDPIICGLAGFEPPAYRRETGMIAQNLQSVIEDAVAIAPFDRDEDGNSKSGDDFLTTKPEKVIPLLVEAVKALTQKVKQLENK